MIRTRDLPGVCVVCLLLAPVAGAGQTVGTTDGAIVGTITDRTGARLPGVTVHASGPAMIGPPRTDVSGEDGSYRLHALPPGEYTLTFTLRDFQTPPREGIRVTLGGTVSVPVTLDLSSRGEEVVVDPGARLLDPHDTTLSTTMDATRLAELPGARSLGSVLAATPAVHQVRFDVGGGNAFAPGVYSAYGIAGFNRPMLEGVSVSGMLPLAYSLDYGAFDEVWVGTGAYRPEWPTPGVHMKIITKPGGNRYSGSVNAAYQDERWQAHNIDEDQLARGAGTAEANRLESYHDLNADVGGFVRRDRLWWYASARDQSVAATRVTFPFAPIETGAMNITGKGTFLAGSHKVVVFGNRSDGRQPIRLDGHRSPEPINESVASTTAQRSRGVVWKAEWNATLSNNLIAEARVGRFAAHRAERPNGAAPRFEDQSEPSVVRGGNRDWQLALQRDLLAGSIDYLRDGRYGRHHLKAGGEIEHSLETETWRQGYAGDVLHVLTAKGAPAQVWLFQTPSESSSGQRWYSAYVNDSWQAARRLTVNLGLRFDRFRVFLPEQHHGVGRFNPVPVTFAAVDSLVDWNLAAPRLGASYALTADGRTILKSNYGLYWLPVGLEVGFNASPNPRSWWQRYRWSDADGSGLWDPERSSSFWILAAAERSSRSIPGSKPPTSRKRRSVSSASSHAPSAWARGWSGVAYAARGHVGRQPWISMRSTCRPPSSIRGRMERNFSWKATARQSSSTTLRPSF